MKVVFLSNFFNHHQKPFSDEMFRLLGENYNFIETKPMSAERLNMGWGGVEYPSYVRKSYVEYDVCQKIVNDADVVITGSAPEKMLVYRKKNKKIIVRYSERPLRHGIEPLKYIPRFIKWHRNNPSKCPIYLLCSSAYTAGDYLKFGLFKNKAYKWAYFTSVKAYDDVFNIIDQKKKHSILWVARFLKLKHPEYAVRLAKSLKQQNYSFEMNMIGAGEEFENIKNMIESESLGEYVHLLGSMTPDRVRSYMENSEIFIFTSDQNEGWGAVVNESMNSACAVVADQRIGSVPFLIKNKENGFSYQSFDEFERIVKMLLVDDCLRKKIAVNAYETMLDLWNPKIAAERCLKLFENIKSYGKCDLFFEGPCSRS